ncbi:hypothetical protein ACOSQ4_015507 [Xanthoceras sorbifolium]
MGEIERSAPLYIPLKPERLVNRMSNGSGGRSFAESTHTSELTMGFKGEVYGFFFSFNFLGLIAAIRIDFA